MRGEGGDQAPTGHLPLDSTAALADGMFDFQQSCDCQVFWGYAKNKIFCRKQALHDRGNAQLTGNS